MEAPTLRPLGIGEVLDVAFKIYVRHWATLFRLVFFVVAPIQLLGAIVFVLTIDNPELISGFDAGSDPTESEVLGYVAATLGIALLGFLASILATAACAKAVGDAYLGRAPDWRSSLRFALSRFGPLLWLSILSGVLLVLALIPLILPALWLWVAWIAAQPALIFEDVRGRRALGRSFALMKQRWWATFAVVLVAYVLAGVMQGIIGGIAGAALVFAVEDSVVGSVLVNAFANTVAGVVSTPLLAAVVVLVYFDLRVRKEGLDIQLLAQNIGVEEPAGGFGTTLAHRPPPPTVWQPPGQQAQPPPPPPGQPPPPPPE